MREMNEAMQAIWANWHKGQPLDFRGEFYQHTLMTPVFTPKPCEFDPPRVFLAAVGPKMIEVAADLCQGMLVHEPNEIVPTIKQRYTGLVDRITINFNYAPLEQRAELVRELEQT